jgi:4-diphosphocytidyl-2-C-methyl-D-erythritol kinase
LAALFGSDTAFFIEAGCQLGEGRGEELRPLEISLNCKLLLAVPDFGCSTPAVFKALDSKFSDKKNQIKDLEMALKTGKLSEIRPKISNDLKSAAQKTVPELENFMNLISSQFDLPCHLSGSGSSCFVLSETELEKPETFEGRYLALFDMHKQQILWEIRS